jgi:hypothetical protein
MIMGGLLQCRLLRAARGRASMRNDSCCGDLAEAAELGDVDEVVELLEVHGGARQTSFSAAGQVDATACVC